MSFAKLNISFSRTLSDIFARFGCIISQLERSSQVHQSCSWVHFCWSNPIQTKNGWY